MSSPVLRWQEDVGDWTPEAEREPVTLAGREDAFIRVRAACGPLCCVGSLTQPFILTVTQGRGGGRHCSQMHFFLLYIGGVNDAQDL